MRTGHKIGFGICSPTDRLHQSRFDFDTCRFFCWALEELDADADSRYQRVKNVEKMFCLASRYRQLEIDQGGEALRGMDGNS
ncbi:MAG: hypothetical protein J07HQW1_01300 [Haloquadratum walsbyi J07HQW1]|uniref:Uncharacterized protein n=1 Tax=Haloquadratum walsbyi J07HQW1 TaxID=1238424 RepID=U1PGL0_9EURY|nr:MAG: hypothetical protein J07HQW1_01300 [Haloquadratum walsbyi J07HQW1]